MGDILSDSIRNTTPYALSTCYTMVFNTSMMSLFNEISRKLCGKINIYKRFFNNSIFYLTARGPFVEQFCIVPYGRQVFNCTNFSPDLVTVHFPRSRGVNVGCSKLPFQMALWSLL